ncbi:hypothetical protein EDB19DRAFT_2026947 [Suillus lakei]|nr:hypothetical protein EDB19DRAFT_2026947 [Suillus lakei]
MNNIQLLVLPQPGSATNSSGVQPSPAASVLSQSSSEFVPFTPSQVMRYDKSPAINHIVKVKVKVDFIPPVKRDYSDPQDSANWCARVHPEGALYFHDTMRGIYTDSYMRDGNRRVRMDKFIKELLGRMPPALELRSGDIELVVESTRRSDTGLRVYRYYFVDHPNRLLFWLDKISTEIIFDGVEGVERWSHIKYAIEHQYWQACHLYRGSLKKEFIETITTDLSLSPFDGDELSKILDLIDRFQGK